MNTKNEMFNIIQNQNQVQAVFYFYFFKFLRKTLVANSLLFRDPCEMWNK